MCSAILFVLINNERNDSEVIRNVVLSYLTERGYILKPKKENVSTDQIAGELDVHDSMITSLVEVLEEKGQLKYSEWENKLKKKISSSSSQHNLT